MHTVINQSNTDIKISNNYSKKDKILVLSLVRNCSNSIKYINKLFVELSQYFDNVHFHYLTNNNKDNKTLIYLDSIKNIVNTTGINYTNKLYDIENRIEYLSILREVNFSTAVYSLQKFDYVIIFDSDLIDFIPTKEIVDSLNISNNWSCITANSIYHNNDFYYDSLALRTYERCCR